MNRIQRSFSGNNYANILFLLMLIGLFFSRALLSFSQVFWILWLLRDWKKNKAFSKSFVIWSGIAPLIGLLGCWQHFFQGNHFDYILTLVMYPIAFQVCARIPLIRLQQWIVFILIAALIGIVYASVTYWQQSSFWQKAYGSGRSLPTFMDGDHVRFGLLLCGTGCLLLITHQFTTIKRVIFLGALLLAIAFMAVRTAWVGMLLILLVYGLNQLLHHSTKKSKGIIIVAGLATLLLIGFAYRYFPTVQQKWAYTRYDWQQYSQDSTSLRYSDGARRIINSLAWKEITENDATNLGWGNIAGSLRAAFEKAYPGYPVSFTWPFNQWLYWWMGAGLGGMLLFTIWLLYPLISGCRPFRWGRIGWTLAIAAACLVESTLSFQYGVWIHAWIGAMVFRIEDLQQLNSHIQTKQSGNS
ncbi:MAG: hypothetical protein FGM61_00475 [Sediminibacterium sp.]|nr:hypothetical protein [Sediminibacterium sp.]